MDRSPGEPQGPGAPDRTIPRPAVAARRRDCPRNGDGRLPASCSRARAPSHLSNMALLTLLKRMNSGASKWLDTKDKRKRPITAHGFRATFKTWAEEIATFPHAVVEQAMGHQVGSRVERAYSRTDLLEKRRSLMEAWGNYCEPATIAGNVTKLRA